MNKLIYFGTFLILGLSIMACHNGEKAQTGGETMEVTTDFSGSADFGIDSRMSEVNWKATELGTGGHQGKIKLQDGVLKVRDNELIGGAVTIAMNTLSVTDLEGDRQAKLEGHLKNDDFFSVPTFPTASFEIATVTPVDTINGATHMIAGNLQIKDITKSVSFPAYIRFVGDAVLATSQPFMIDRTEWGVNYRSGLLGTIKDRIIDDEVRISLKVRGLAPQAQ